MAITIRTATLADSALIRELGVRIFTDTFGPANTPENMEAYLEVAFAAERVLEEVADPASLHLVAEADGEAAGYARLRAGAGSTEVGGERPIELVRLYVERARHGGGVAAALMKASIDHARHAGHDVMYLGVWEHNPRAIAFYRKWGFEKVGEHVFLLGEDEQADWLMRRPV